MPVFNYQLPIDLAATGIVVYLLLSSVISFDRKEIEMMRKGELPSDFTLLPLWMEYLYWLELLLPAIFFLMNWKLAVFSLLLKILLNYSGLLPYIGRRLVERLRKSKSG